MQAATRQRDNLTWFQSPLINSSSGKATALITSVVAEGPGFSPYFTACGGCRAIQTVKSSMLKCVLCPCLSLLSYKHLKHLPICPILSGTFELSEHRHQCVYHAFNI